MTAIKKSILEAGAKAVPGQPLDIILGGGTATPPGFVELFSAGVKEAQWPIPIGDIRRPEDHLYSVAKGCLLAAENHMN